ncbi:hypothetical protein U1Q18_037835 [Sarracenia purpurea var. burkii]
MNVDEGQFVQCVIAVQLMMTTCVLHARGCWLKKEEVMMNFSCRPSKYAVCGWVLITDLDDFKPHWSIACLWFWDSSSFNLRIFDGCYESGTASGGNFTAILVPAGKVVFFGSDFGAKGWSEPQTGCRFQVSHGCLAAGLVSVYFYTANLGKRSGEESVHLRFRFWQTKNISGFLNRAPVQLDNLFPANLLSGFLGGRIAGSLIVPPVVLCCKGRTAVPAGARMLVSRIVGGPTGNILGLFPLEFSDLYDGPSMGLFGARESPDGSLFI